MSIRTDTERLDWLERQDLCEFRRWEDHVDLEVGDLCDYEANTFRDAIDAAMDEEDEP
jgi:hypothetical protein